MTKPADSIVTIEEFHYRTGLSVQGHLPGFHRGTVAGGGMAFRRHVSLLDSLDPRRVDIRASLHDPFEQILIRQHSHNVAIPVCAVADLSASLAHGQSRTKLHLMADFASSLAYSAYRTGDPFAFIECSNEPELQFSDDLSINKNTAHLLTERLCLLQPRGTDHSALLNVSNRLPARRSLVFLVSDYYFSVQLLHRILGGLMTHFVIPVMLEDTCEGSEFATLRKYGVTRIRDVETGQTRLMLMRPSLKRRIQQAYAWHRESIIAGFRSHGLSPMILTDSYRAEDVSRYFLETALR